MAKLLFWNPLKLAGTLDMPWPLRSLSSRCCLLQHMRLFKCSSQFNWLTMLQTMQSRGSMVYAMQFCLGCSGQQITLLWVITILTPQTVEDKALRMMPMIPICIMTVCAMDTALSSNVKLLIIFSRMPATQPQAC